MVRLLCVGLLFLALRSCVSPASSLPETQSAYHSAAYNRCLEAARGVRPREHCTAREIERQARALDVTYRELVARLHNRQRDGLATRESDWSSRMQAECTVYSRRRGSLNSMKAHDCFLRETIRRRAVLARSSH